MQTKTPLPPLPSKECIPLRSLVHSASCNFAEKMWQRTSWKFSLKRWKAIIQNPASAIFQSDLFSFGLLLFGPRTIWHHLQKRPSFAITDGGSTATHSKAIHRWMDGLDPTKKVLLAVLINNLPSGRITLLLHAVQLSKNGVKKSRINVFLFFFGVRNPDLGVFWVSNF